MTHPFNLTFTELEMLDLEFEQSLVSEEAAQVNGAFYPVTRALGEAGDDCGPRPRPRPKPLPPKPIDPPIYTTLALGEEGGCWNPPEVTTMALGEEGGDFHSCQF